MVENEAAHEKHFVPDYTVLKDMILSGPNHFVVIMTLGYRSDDVALKALLGKEFKYIGLLGSKFKVGKMFDDYRKDGVNEDWLQRIHTPVGLAIKRNRKSAVSIAAEIIRVKNEHL
jgi:xanthine dehydrogenase accessory factor